jgi:glycosyltransferase involved in cell wall biosynthesis
MKSSGVKINCVAPKISVLMAVFDTPSIYLDEAIGSILSQSFGDFEFIIIDDGSSAETESRLCYWAKRDPRIRLYRGIKNIGLTKALNIGLDLVRGKYVARQDADDMSDRFRLEEQLRFMECHPNFDAVGTNAILIDASARKVGTLEIPPDLKGLDRRNILVHGSMFFRGAALKLAGGYDKRMLLSQDYELYLRMIHIYQMSIGVLSEQYYLLRQHSASLSSHYIFRQLYYSVLAKHFATNNSGRKRLGIQFYFSLIFEYFITHRLFLGFYYRNCMRLLRK